MSNELNTKISSQFSELLSTRTESAQTNLFEEVWQWTKTHPLESAGTAAALVLGAGSAIRYLSKRSSATLQAIENGTERIAAKQSAIDTANANNAFYIKEGAKTPFETGLPGDVQLREILRGVSEASQATPKRPASDHQFSARLRNILF
ncbi:MAG: hypothetical protein K2X77_30735 [Candidatus Obscuribacterales bacterium]|jgi:hypothetical protein|nr:hypothetical protein [Candidatus Obscuribacterales bacterium]